MPLSLPRLRALRPPGGLASAALFGALVIATVGAFFVTTRLKRSPPVVAKLTFTRYLSPNGDGRRDFADFGFRLKRSDEVTVSVVTKDGDEVKAIVRDRELQGGRHQFRWDGRTSSGVVAPDGEYRLRVGLRRQGRSVTSPRKLFVDTRPPRPVVRYVTPDSISPDGAGSGNRARLRFDGPRRRRPELFVYRTDLRSPRLVARRQGQPGSNELSWDGRAGGARRGRPASTGNYLLVVRVRDAAGNLGPAPLSPRPGRSRGHPGVSVRYVAARTPSYPVRAGTIATFRVEPDRRRYDWSVRRLGSSHVLDRGSSRSATLHLRAPRGRSGVFLLRLRVGSHRYETPFAVQASRKRKVLVVLPALSWQTANTLDGNGDGFADRLSRDRRVKRRRAFGGGGLPPGFTAREAPLLLYLDRSGRRYDITTDVALAAGGPSRLARHTGVLFAGPPRFYSPRVAELVRAYVRSRGRLIWLGTGGFSRPLKLSPDSLELVSRPRGENAFGERLRPQRTGGLLTVLGDTIDFFAGAGESFGPFPSLEQSRKLPPRSRLLAAAGHEAHRPAIVVYRLGGGIVVRLGVDGFSRATGSPAVARIMGRLWILLSR